MLFRSDPSPSALQAIEFWSTICEEEILLAKLLADVCRVCEACCAVSMSRLRLQAAKRNQQPEAFSCFYIQGALPYLMGMLLQTMCRQEDDQEENTWNISMAAGTCLDLVARCVHDEVIPHVMPFVKENIGRF